MQAQGITKAAMARRMHTSHSMLDRLLDATDTGLTIDTLSRAAQALGYRVKIELAAYPSRCLPMAQPEPAGPRKCHWSTRHTPVVQPAQELRHERIASDYREFRIARRPPVHSWLVAAGARRAGSAGQ